MYTFPYDMLRCMARPRTPSPEMLGKTTLLSQRVVTFRLNDPEHDALLALSDRAGIGHSALARRIVEAYIAEHAPRNKAPRTLGRRR